MEGEEVEMVIVHNSSRNFAVKGNRNGVMT